MCGIVGFTGTQNAAPVLLDGLSKLEYRGYDSAGIAVVQGNRIAISKVTGRIQNLREKTEDGRLVPGTTGIGHTRWATHGAPNDINAHPHASNVLVSCLLVSGVFLTFNSHFIRGKNTAKTNR